MNTVLGNKRNLIIVALGVIFLVIGGLFIAFQGLNPIGPDSPKGTAKIQANLMMWGVWDSSSLMGEYIDQFNKRYPNIQIEYRKQSAAQYEDQLVNALAEERGPDIFAMHHTWLNKHKPKMAPAPERIITEKKFRERFVSVVEEDFISEKGNIYGMPLYVDTLALYYNRDMFDDAGIVDPPKTWSEFQSDVKKLTKINEFGRIEQAGATLGTVNNINRPQDIVGLIIEQSLAARQNKTMPNFGNDAGEQGLKFYTDFANPQKTVYSWNKNQNYSVDAFANGKAAMTIGYSYLAEQIEAKSPRLNFQISKVPQISTESDLANYTNYWGYTVSSQASDAERFAAYLFLKFLTNKQNVQDYFVKTKRPTSRQDLIEKQSQNLQYGVFAEQILNAETWDQPNNSKVDEILGQMIKDVNSGAATADEAASNAASQIQSLMR